MSAEATAYVWKHSTYEGRQLLIHLAVADTVNDTHGNEFYGGVRGLVAKTRAARSTVLATLAEMVEKGDLERLGVHESGTASYRFLFRLGGATTGPPVQPLDGGGPEKCIDTSYLTKEELKTRARTAKGTSVPESFPIGGELARWTLTILRRESVSTERDAFLDYHRARGSVFKDWDAAWRTWVRRAATYRPEVATGANAAKTPAYVEQPSGYDPVTGLPIYGDPAPLSPPQAR